MSGEPLKRAESLRAWGGAPVLIERAGEGRRARLIDAIARTIDEPRVVVWRIRRGYFFSIAAATFALGGIAVASIVVPMHRALQPAASPTSPVPVPPSGGTRVGWVGARPPIELTDKLTEISSEFGPRPSAIPGGYESPPPQGGATAFSSRRSTVQSRVPSTSMRGSSVAANGSGSSVDSVEIAAAPPAAASSTPFAPGRGAPPRPVDTLGAQNGLLQSALAARRHGEDSEAERLLSSLMKTYPDSPLIQEAMVERFRTLVHHGQTFDARERAREYLTRFPAGFARDEARRIVSADAPPSSR